MAKRHGVGIIGAGDISASYLRLSPLFGNFEIRAIASRSLESAQARAQQFGIEAMSIEALLAREDITAIVNLTPPTSHFEVSKSILSAGKHVYSEKPFVLDLTDGEALLSMAKERGLTVASAPDTFLGGAHQAVRVLVDSGDLGTISSGTCIFMNFGMEHRHPNPRFFFQPGGGPILDIAPYYVTNVVHLLGPVRRVTAFGNKGRDTRTVTSPGAHFGETISVDVFTTVHAILEFVSGAVVSVTTSWDVLAHSHKNHIELYGDQGSLFIPDPDFFGGIAVSVGPDGTEHRLSPDDHPFGPDNEFLATPDQRANYRGAGLADMLMAIDAGVTPRCDGSLALHVIDILTGIATAAEERRTIEMTTSCSRPLPLTKTDAQALLGAETGA